MCLWPDAANVCARALGGGTLNRMDSMVEVQLVGGPMDGGTLRVVWDAVYEDPEPGFDFVPIDGSGAPDDEDGTPLSRVSYTAAPEGPADVWHWRGWVLG